MKLVADIDKIMGNTITLGTDISNYYNGLSQFGNSNPTFTTPEVENLIQTFVNTITTDLNTLYDSSNEYLSLVDECCSAYQDNEANFKEIDISTVTNISLTDGEISNLDKHSSSEKSLLDDVSLLTAKTSVTEIDTASIKPGSRIAKAYEKYGKELENATYAKVNDKVFMTITETKVNGKSCYVSHVVVENPSQIYGEPAKGNYATGLETASSAAKRTGASLVINGSHFLYGNGAEDNTVSTNNVVIVDGNIKSGGTAQNMEICLSKDGRLFTSNKTADQLLNEGVVYTFASHGAPMIENGAISPICAQETRAYNRTVIGMVEPCDYYVVTDTECQSQSSTANYLLEKGCTFAKSLDQGGSVSLVYNGNLVNTPRDGAERAIGDFICFEG